MRCIPYYGKGVLYSKSAQVIFYTLFGLKLAKTFVLLLTPDSAKSQWVRRELAIAINNYVNTKVKVVLSGGFTVSDIRSDNELEFLLDRVQIRYQYSDLVHSSNTLKAFIDD